MSSKRQAIDLPDRKEISLCEAVTAVIYGKAVSVEEYQRHAEEHLSKIESESGLGFFDKSTPANKQIAPDEQPPANEQTAKWSDLLERLRKAAYDGRIKFRAIKDYANPADGLKDIDPIYFYYNRTFIWTQDEIHSLEDESSTIWSCVHLDRQQFVSFLQELGVSVQQNLDPRAPQNVDAETPADLSDLETSGTGLAGRPQSVRFVLPLAKKRLDAGDYPDTKTEFAKQVARDFAKAAPKAHRPTPKALVNNAAFSEMWRRRKPRKDPS
jgi:hypothetical protein